jgi:hypothetical protein
MLALQYAIDPRRRQRVLYIRENNKAQFMKIAGDDLDFHINQVFANGEIAAVSGGGMYVAVAEYAKKRNLDRQAIVDFLRRRGKTEGSAQSIASRIWKLMSPENATVLAQLKSGEITVRKGRSAAGTRQANPAKPSLPPESPDSRLGGNAHSTRVTFAA